MTRPPGFPPPEISRIYDCPGCYVRCYPGNEWEAMTAEQRRASGGREGVGGFCSRCYGNPAAREPEPGAELVEPVCPDCGATLVTRGHWSRADAAEKAELREEGYQPSKDMIRCRRDQDRREKEAARG